MRLTGRGGAVLAAAVLLTAYGWWGSYALATALGLIGLAAVLAALPSAGGRLRVEVSRSIAPDRVERGRPAVATLRVRNPGSRRRPGFAATDTIGRTPRTVRVGGLRAGAETVHEYALPTTTRGRVTVGPLVLDRVDPLGLARNRQTVGGEATLVVHPRQLAVRSPSGPLTAGARRGSADLHDVREYAPGDEVRHLHWKATAHTGRLMVRDLADARQGRLTVVLDSRAGVLPPDAFEDAVDLAASLLCAAARAGHRSELVTASGRTIAVRGGAPGIRQFLDMLAAITPDADPGGELPSGRPVVITAGHTAPPPGTGVVITLGDSPGGRTGTRVLRAEDAADAIRRWNGTTW